MIWLTFYPLKICEGGGFTRPPPHSSKRGCPSRVRVHVGGCGGVRVRSYVVTGTWKLFSTELYFSLAMLIWRVYVWVAFDGNAA